MMVQNQATPQINTHAVLPYQTDGAIDALIESGGFTLCSLEFYTNASLLLDLTSRMNNCSLSEEHFETTLKLQSLHCISRPLKIQTVHVPSCVLHSVFAIKLDWAHQSIKIKGSACRSNICNSKHDTDLIFGMQPGTNRTERMVKKK